MKPEKNRIEKGPLTIYAFSTKSQWTHGLCLRSASLYVCACVRACVCACVRACVRACVHRVSTGKSVQTIRARAQPISIFWIATILGLTNWRNQSTIILHGNADIPRTRNSDSGRTILGLREVYEVFRQVCFSLSTSGISCSPCDVFVDTKSD